MNLQPFLEYTLLGLPVAHITIALAIFLFALLFKNILAAIILKPFKTIAKTD